MKLFLLAMVLSCVVASSAAGTQDLVSSPHNATLPCCSAEIHPTACTSNTPKPEYKYSAAFYPPGIIFPVVSVGLHIASIAAIEARLCILGQLLSASDIAIINLNAASIIVNTFLLFEGPVMQAAPNVIFCKHIAYILHFSLLYQTVSLACLGVELARMAIRNRKPDRSGCKTGFIYIMVSLLVPALIVAPTVLTYSINRSLVQYGVTSKNTLQCWINNPTALITSSTFPSLLALVCCCTGLGMGLLLTLSKRFRSVMRRYLPLSIGSDSHSQQRMPLTRYLLLALTIAVCAVCSLLAIIFILHLVLTDLMPIHIIEFLQLVKGIVIAVVVLYNKKIRMAIKTFFRRGQLQDGVANGIHPVVHGNMGQAIGADDSNTVRRNKAAPNSPPATLTSPLVPADPFTECFYRPTVTYGAAGPRSRGSRAPHRMVLKAPSLPTIPEVSGY